MRPGLRPGPNYRGKLQNSLDPQMVFGEPLRGRGVARGKGEKEEEKKEGLVFPHFFVQFNHCSPVYSCCDLYTVARLIALQLVCSSSP